MSFIYTLYAYVYSLAGTLYTQPNPSLEVTLLYRFYTWCCSTSEMLIINKVSAFHKAFVHKISCHFNYILTHEEFKFNYLDEAI